MERAIDYPNLVFETVDDPPDPRPNLLIRPAMTWALTMSPASEFQGYYHSLSNFELESIALSESATLPPQALVALRKEMDQRGLSGAIRRGIEAQVRRWTKADLATFIEQYRHRPCPRCGVQGKRLNGVVAAVARGFIVTSIIRTKLVIGCSGCINAELARLSRQSVLFGWLGIPWGLVHTVRALAVNSKAKAAAASATPTAELWNYIASNVVEIAVDTRSTYRAVY
jgi:hypothetical protein